MTDKPPSANTEDRSDREAPAPDATKDTRREDIPASPNEGRLGPAADPAEGKRQ
jgi:hypothetical protein